MATATKSGWASSGWACLGSCAGWGRPPTGGCGWHEGPGLVALQAACSGSRHLPAAATDPSTTQHPGQQASGGRSVSMKGSRGRSRGRARGGQARGGSTSRGTRGTSSWAPACSGAGASFCSLLPWRGPCLVLRPPGCPQPLALRPQTGASSHRPGLPAHAACTTARDAGVLRVRSAACSRCTDVVGVRNQEGLVPAQQGAPSSLKTAAAGPGRGRCIPPIPPPTPRESARGEKGQN